MDYILYSWFHFIDNPVNSLSWIPNKCRLKAPILHGGVTYIQNKAVQTKKLHRKITIKWEKLNPLEKVYKGIKSDNPLD